MDLHPWTFQAGCTVSALTVHSVFFAQLKIVSKVLGQLCDSRVSYIASVTIVQRAGQCSATDKVCKKALIKLIKRPLVAISGHDSNTYS